MKKGQHLPYSEGDWFAVPLNKGTFGVGRLARKGGKWNVLFGYFFGPPRAEVPPESELISLKATDAIMLSRFGDLYLISGRWQIIRDTQAWSRLLWPMPAFGRVDSAKQAWETVYDDDEPNQWVDMQKSTLSKIAVLPKDSVMGAGFVEKRLARLLHQGGK